MRAMSKESGGIYEKARCFETFILGCFDLSSKEIWGKECDRV